MQNMQAPGTGIQPITEINPPTDAQPEFEQNSGLSLFFPAGQRPSADDILRLTAPGNGDTPRFAVSHAPERAAGWLELIADGQTFDLIGLAPAQAAPRPALAHYYGLADGPMLDACEAITLLPGEHLRGAENLLPVVRIMTGLALGLARLAGTVAIAWHPARTAIATNAFVSAITDWLQGGVFPALGLIAIYQDGDGAIRSEGLAFFTGQELLITPSSVATAQDAKLAARLIHDLVGKPAIGRRLDIVRPSGESISVTPARNGRVLTIWRNT